MVEVSIGTDAQAELDRSSSNICKSLMMSSLSATVRFGALVASYNALIQV